MKRTIRTLLLFFVSISMCLTPGCRSKGSTRLCDGFQSYEKAQEIRDRLGQASLIGRWQEKMQAVKSPDPRPPYEMLTLSGPFSLSGIDGRLDLTLYNDRLMSAQFSTRNGHEFLAKLKEEHVKTPANSGNEIEIDRRTKFEYYIDSDGTFRFLWTDPKLESEWNEWVRRFA